MATKKVEVKKVVKKETIKKETIKPIINKVTEPVVENTAEVTEPIEGISEDLINIPEYVEDTQTPEEIIKEAMDKIEGTFLITPLNRGLFGSMYNTLKEAKRLAKELE